MQELLPKDGEHVIYRVAVMLHGGEWHNWDHGFVTDKIPREVRWKDASRGIPNDPFRSFTASGDCWQTTSIHGTFDRDEAVSLANILAESVPEFQYRVDRVELSQKRTTEVTVECMKRKATCPTSPDHKRFGTTVHVTETWVVNERGEFIEVCEGGGETTHGPDPGNTWTCEECGEQATVVD